MKILRNITCFALVLATFGKTLAQDADPAPKPTFEVGIQTNALFDRLLPEGEGSLVQNPYLLTGEMGLGQLAIRAGIGGAHNRDVQRVEGFANSITALRQRLDLRLGVERRFPLGDRWTGSLGLDAVGHWAADKIVNDSGFDVITDTDEEQSFGGGLATGIKYQATRRLSFGTEAFFYFLAGERTVGQFFKNFPTGEDEIQKTETSRLQIGLPNSLYLILEF